MIEMANNNKRGAEIGKRNALEAFDQIGTYGSLKDALYNYWINASDSVCEEKLGQRANGHCRHAFDDVVRSKGFNPTDFDY